MTTMLEKAARAALWSEMDHDPGVWNTQPSEWEVSSLHDHGYFKIARAVLMAVRDDGSLNFQFSELSSSSFINGYIDAILSEKPE